MIQRNYYPHLQKKDFKGLLNQSIEIDILQSDWEHIFQPKWKATQVFVRKQMPRFSHNGHCFSPVLIISYATAKLHPRTYDIHGTG